MKKSVIVAAIAAAAVLAVHAQQPLKPETQLQLRKAAYSLMNYSLANLDAMTSGKRPLNRDEAVRSSELLVHLSTVPKGFFGEGTDKGETRAKPEIWTNRADFDAKMDKMVAEAAKLPQAARASDAGVLKKAVNDLEAACSACHDDYRAKRR